MRCGPVKNKIDLEQIELAPLIELYPTKGYKLNGQEKRIDLPEAFYFELIRCSRLAGATKEEYLGFALQYWGNIPKESYYQIMVAQALEKGLGQKIIREHKVSSGIGRVDLMCSSLEFIIEVKFYTGWKSALGQILAYWSNLRLSPAILLLDSGDELPIKNKTIVDCCGLFGVKVFFLDINDLSTGLNCLIDDVRAWSNKTDGDKNSSKMD